MGGRCEELKQSTGGGRGRKCNVEVDKKGTVGAKEDTSEHGGKSRGLEVRNGVTNLRKENE